MSLPYFTDSDHTCERCEQEIRIGYEAILHEDGMFCDKECLTEHLYETSLAKEIHLTNDKIYRSVD